MITAVFRHLESRGTDASGFWGSEQGNGRIIYHKEPIRSSQFVQKNFWQESKYLNSDLLLLHARQASLGSGLPSENINNHPFVSSDKQIALVHNGKIIEYDTLTKKYMVNSKCDSEILLRMFEAGGEDSSVESRLNGLRDIWSHVVSGHMAVAIGERYENGERRLWLFRNRFRTLWLIDLRKTLGQIFFCSTPDIWRRAISDCSWVWENIRKKAKLIELPIDQIWSFNLRANSDRVDNGDISKFEVKHIGVSEFEHDGEPIAIAQKEPVCEIVTKLDENEEPMHKPFKQDLSCVIPLKQTLHISDSDSDKFIEDNDAALDDNFDVRYKQFEDGCDEIDRLVRDIRATAHNKKQEGSLTVAKMEFDEIMQSIEDVQLELRGTLEIMKNC